jgi:UBX domain-containing protein 1
MKLSSLGDLRRKQEAEEEKKKSGQEYYTGGIDRRSGGGSGLAVQDPPRPDDNDILGRIVRRAQNNSAELEAAPPSTGGGGGEMTRITLWANGFQINSGEFRPATDPSNQQFLTTLAAGFVPEELRGGGTDMQVGVEDKRSEEFTPPPPPRYVAFGGDAMSLRTAASASELVINPTEFMDLPHVTDDGSPMTVIQVKLLDGKKIKVK